jgi:SAM-dependent MidA family methyltransferase
MASMTPSSTGAPGAPDDTAARTPPAADARRLAALHALIEREMAGQDGWLPFERFMSLALYAPGLGYYSATQPIATSAGSGDFITAPELSPLFARALARQILQALQATGTRQVWEFGPGRGTLAAQLLRELGDDLDAYHLVDLSGTLRARQQAAVDACGAALAAKARWHDRLPDALDGVLVGNEVLDAMPVQLIAFDGQRWLERGVIVERATPTPRFAWADRAPSTPLAPPVHAQEFPAGSVTELHPTAEGWVRTLAAHLRRGAMFLIDYGFPEAEYYLPQRHQGTLVCHRRHLVDADPLGDVGDKDITAHVNFTGIALSGQDAGLDVLGYTSQARFLMNCGLLDDLRDADPRVIAPAQKLLSEHEMGELFKVIGFAKGAVFDALGFAEGDRTHTL